MTSKRFLLLVGCLTSVPHASERKRLYLLSHWYKKRRSTFLTQSQYTDAGTTSNDPITPGVIQVIQRSTNIYVTGMTRLTTRPRGAAGIEAMSLV